MMKKILVVSDNPTLVLFFKEECADQRVGMIADVTFCYSAINKSPEAMISMGASSIDMKDPKCISEVRNGFDLVFSLHCKQIFPSELVTSISCVNVHPGLNPFNRGWYPQVFSIINGKPIGATIHLMDEYVDHGDIIDQEEVEMRASDTSLEVYERVFEAEKRLIRKNLYSIINMEFCTKSLRLEGNYNSIVDFRSLCQLDLNVIGSLREHIDLLRALSHGEFKNAFFLDDSGNKVYIRVILER